MKKSINLVVNLNECADIPLIYIEDDYESFISENYRYIYFNLSKFMEKSGITSQILSPIQDLKVFLDSRISENLLEQKFKFIESKLSEYIYRIKFSKQLELSFSKLNESDKEKHKKDYTLFMANLMGSGLDYIYAFSFGIQCNIVNDKFEISFGINSSSEICKINIIDEDRLEFVYIKRENIVIQSIMDKYYLKPYLKGFCSTFN